MSLSFPRMARIFIDTEFTDLVDLDLISIALVAEDGREFYAERNDFDRAKCNDFVVENVLPLLGAWPSRVMSNSDLACELCAWLAQFEPEGAVICFDFVGDIGLLIDLVGPLPAWLSTANIKHKIDKDVWNEFLHLVDQPAHHALWDARANRAAYRSTT